MAKLAGPGPVFVYEWITGTRRWQLYGTRALFVAALLIAIAMVWETVEVGGRTRNQTQVRLAQNVYLAIVGTQLVLVLFAAPAATAGAVCLDKARGTLAHVLVTDLTDAEIVLGKLAARLVPVLTFIACSLPVVYLCTLLGGIDPDALLGAYLVTCAVAVLGCSLALTLSVWASKTHEVLLATYLVFIIWLLAGPMTRTIAGATGGYVDLTGLARLGDPFDLCFATYSRPGSASIGEEMAYFVAGCLALSLGLVALAVLRVRKVAAAQAGERPRPRRRPVQVAEGNGGSIRAFLNRNLPGPTLDGNPVLWREWHRNRPTGWTARVWTVYMVGALVFTVIAFLIDVLDGNNTMRGRTSLWVNGFEVAIGMLLLSLGAATSLAEERVRGSLDVLMTTPLETRSIVWGKWLGTFRTVGILAVLPIALTSGIALWSGRWFEVWLMFLEIIAYGAFIASMGLALATWVPRLGRAVALCVAGDLFLTVGLFFIILMIVRGPDGERMLAFTPFGGPAILTVDAGGQMPMRRTPWLSGTSFDFLSQYSWEILSIILYSSGAAVLLWATFRTFDRCLGRATPNARGPLLPVVLHPIAPTPAVAE